MHNCSKINFSTFVEYNVVSDLNAFAFKAGEEIRADLFH